MKKTLTAILLTAFAFFACNAFAADASTVKMGIINMQQILQDSPQAKTINANLEKKFADRKKKVADAQAKFQKDVAAFQKNSAVLSAADKKKESDKLTAEQQNLQQMSISFQQDLMNEQNKMYGDFVTKVKGIIANIAEQDKLTLVVYEQATAFSAPSMDITRQVMAKLAS